MGCFFFFLCVCLRDFLGRGFWISSGIMGVGFREKADEWIVGVCVVFSLLY